jgi:hypothetical protein
MSHEVSTRCAGAGSSGPRLGAASVRFALLAALIAPAISLSGCSLLPFELAPMGLEAAEAVGVATARTATGDKMTTDEEDAGQCEQLKSALPFITEVKRESDGAFEIRQLQVDGTSAPSDKPRWTIMQAKDANPDGWHHEPITQLNFSPPLETALTQKDKAQYLIFAPAQATDNTESEQLVSFIGFFGPAAGTFQWHGRTYNYAVAKKLPCFAIAS